MITTFFGDVDSLSDTRYTHLTKNSPAKNLYDEIVPKAVDDYLDNEDENAPQQIPQISPYGLFSNLLPFGHPSIGQRHLLAVETYNNSILSNNNHLNHIVHSKRKKHHRKSTSKKKNKMHNNHRRAYN